MRNVLLNLRFVTSRSYPNEASIASFYIRSIVCYAVEVLHGLHRFKAVKQRAAPQASQSPWLYN